MTRRMRLNAHQPPKKFVVVLLLYRLTDFYKNPFTNSQLLPHSKILKKWIQSFPLNFEKISLVKKKRMSVLLLW